MMNNKIKLDKYFGLILPIIRKHGFGHLKIEDILKQMTISKATFYKYFSSRDDLIEQIVTDYAAHIIEVDPIVMDDTVPFERRFRKIFEQSLLSILIMTDVFYTDLRNFQPGLLSAISSAQLKRCDLLQQFYHSGFQQNLFNPINPTVFFLQDDVVIRRLMDPMLLHHYDTTIKQHILDFYHLKKHALFTADHLHTVDDAAIEQEVGRILSIYAV